MNHDIEQAMNSREARVAVLVSNNFQNVPDMLDMQPPVVIEAITERVRRSGCTAKHRKEFWASLIEYLEQRARRRGAGAPAGAGDNRRRSSRHAGELPGGKGA